LVKSTLNHEPDGSEEDYHYVQSGRDVSEKVASELEARLIKDPKDMRARLSLIGYYQGLPEEKKDAANALIHLLWMVEHRPADFVCYTLSLGREFTDEQYNEFEKRWTEQIRLHPNDDKIAGNAGSALAHRNRHLSWQYFKLAQALNPIEPRWTRRLAKRARYEALNGNLAERVHYAQVAIAEAEKYFKLEDTTGEQIGTRLEITPVAIEFGYLKQARQWSNWLLERTRNSTFRLWAQTALLFLARIEIIEGQPQKSKTMLRKALVSLKTDEHSHIASGHQMVATLDKLLESGERKVVVEALRVCVDKGSEDRREQLQEWLKLLEQGENPKLEWSGIR